MAKHCGKCSEAITGIDVVVCRGYCGAFFHIITCSGVSRALQSYFTSNSKNLFWMCDDCAELFQNSHFRVITSHVDKKSPLNSLSTAISELRTEIKHLRSKPTTQVSPATNSLWPTIDQRRGAKRPREMESPARVPELCQIGNKQAQDNVASVPIFKNDVDQKFWLYLSRICPDVTEEAVRAMTKANLEINSDPAVVKLVPKGKDTNTLSFVSFKIGLDPSLKSKALNPATWPEGLLFREFEDLGAQKFRFPLKTNKPTTLSVPLEVFSSPITPVMDLS